MQSALSAPGAATWQDDLRLGWGPIDAIHEEFLELVDTLRSASDEAMPAALAAVHQHSREHFAAEERWMEETDFPARGCHADEHAAVLASMEGVARKVAAGDFEAGRRLARALVDWFPGHADYLDSALAHWMCKKRLGGQPIVLRRSAAVPTHA
jgi:hemerythrin